jgi:hypothetical protein
MGVHIDKTQRRIPGMRDGGPQHVHNAASERGARKREETSSLHRAIPKTENSGQEEQDCSGSTK